MPGVIVIGAGPGIGLSVARRFARDGHAVGVVARSPSTVDAATRALEADGAEAAGEIADATDEAGLRAALDALADRFGVPDVLVYNAAVIRQDALGDLDAVGHLDSWAVNVVGAITAAAHVVPPMTARGHGTVIVTGGMPEPDPGLMSLSLGKVGVRALVRMLDAQAGPDGVHAATVTVCGPVAPGSAFDPDDIAEHYVRLHAQAPGEWEHEVLHTGEHTRRGTTAP